MALLGSSRGLIVKNGILVTTSDDGECTPFDACLICALWNSATLPYFFDIEVDWGPGGDSTDIFGQTIHLSFQGATKFRLYPSSQQQCLFSGASFCVPCDFVYGTFSEFGGDGTIRISIAAIVSALIMIYADSKGVHCYAVVEFQIFPGPDSPFGGAYFSQPILPSLPSSFTIPVPVIFGNGDTPGKGYTLLNQKVAPKVTISAGPNAGSGPPPPQIIYNNCPPGTQFPTSPPITLPTPIPPGPCASDGVCDDSIETYCANVAGLKLTDNTTPAGPAVALTKSGQCISNNVTWSGTNGTVDVLSKFVPSGSDYSTLGYYTLTVTETATGDLIYSACRGSMQGTWNDPFAFSGINGGGVIVNIGPCVCVMASCVSSSYLPIYSLALEGAEIDGTLVVDPSGFGGTSAFSKSSLSWPTQDLLMSQIGTQCQWAQTTVPTATFTRTYYASDGITILGAPIVSSYNPSWCIRLNTSDQGGLTPNGFWQLEGELTPFGLPALPVGVSLGWNVWAFLCSLIGPPGMFSDGSEVS